MTSIAFLGLGNMGGGMASRLAAAGFPLSVWNRGRQRAERFRDLGVTIADTPRAAAATADVIISMLADDEASRAVWLGAEGALSGARPGAVLIESGTVSPTWIGELAELAAERGHALLDAPVTGSKTQAAAGELLFLVGGDASILDRARPVLAAMSRDIAHLGPLGNGARMKLVNNFVCGVQAAALAEAIALIERSNLDRSAALSVLQNGAPGSPLVKVVGNRMAERDYAVNFRLALMRKDLTYAIDEAERQGVPLATARAARELFEQAEARALGERDLAAVVEVLRG